MEDQINLKRKDGQGVDVSTIHLPMVPTPLPGGDQATTADELKQIWSDSVKEYSGTPDPSPEAADNHAAHDGRIRARRSDFGLHDASKFVVTPEVLVEGDRSDSDAAVGISAASVHPRPPQASYQW